MRFTYRSFALMLVVAMALAIPRSISFARSFASPFTSSLTSAQRGRRVASEPTQRIPTPKDVIGFTPGDDRKLASWGQIVEYFQRLDQSSNRVKLEEIGKTTLGRPFVLAYISSPSNLARLDHFKEIQRKLADPRTFNSNDTEAEKLIADGRTIVLITCGIHSTEVGGNLVSMNIAYQLASDDSPETREILDRCIVLMVPSLNPDGVDIVKAWYDKTLGTKSEGTNPPELYHHYTGHDNNRDWYAFTQVETQLTVDKIQNVWHPQIVHDIHQQGDTGSRFFLPPYVDPWEPNVSPIIQAGVNFMGTSMAWELIAEGRAGVVTNGVYDAWSPSRAYQHYHGGIRILSETASARIASPANISFDKLTPQIGVDPKIRSANFPLIWPGGEWRLSNIVDYMKAGAFALLRNAARYRERWVRDFYRVGKDAVAERRTGEPFGFLVLAPKPGDEWAREGFARIVSILRRGDVEVGFISKEFEVDHAKVPKGSAFVLMKQPYGSFAKTLLESQRYPDLREYPGGPPRRPYDVTAQTLPLLMGVSSIRLDQQIEIPLMAGDRELLQLGADSLRRSDGISTTLRSRRIGIYKSYAASMDEGWTRWIFDQFNLKYSSLDDTAVRAGDLSTKYDCIIIPAQSSQQIRIGLSAERYPSELSGGISQNGVNELLKFIDAGGTVITLNEASQFAIDQLGVPVKNVLEGVPPKDFYCPGSILKIKLDTSSSISKAAPLLGSSSNESIAWVEGSLAFETTSPDARVVARFADSKDLLLSGWLLGGDRLANKGAIVDITRGKGRVVMFAFRPQYRGQSIATFPFLLNAMTGDPNAR